MSVSVWLAGTYTYDDERAYGGPEEGGWYYNTSSRDSLHVFLTKAEADAFSEAFYSICERGQYCDVREFDIDGLMDDPEFPSCHIWDDAPQVEQTVARLMPLYTPQGRPHYC